VALLCVAEPNCPAPLRHKHLLEQLLMRRRQGCGKGAERKRVREGERESARETKKEMWEPRGSAAILRGHQASQVVTSVAGCGCHMTPTPGALKRSTVVCC
jgi:hypothetical protein